MRIAITCTALLALTACASQPVRDSLTITDYMRLIDAREQAFEAPTGQQAMWANTLTGMGGTVTPMGEPTVIDGRPCRQLQEVTRATTGRVDDRTRTACQGLGGVLTVEED